MITENTKITWTDLHDNTDKIAAAVIPLCETDTDGIEDWLSAASTDYSGTPADLATEWDALNNG